MIASLWEVKKAKEIAASVRDELKGTGSSVRRCRIGIMIEDPSGSDHQRRPRERGGFLQHRERTTLSSTLAIDRQNEKLDQSFTIETSGRPETDPLCGGERPQIIWMYGGNLR